VGQKNNWILIELLTFLGNHFIIFHGGRLMSIELSAEFRANDTMDVIHTLETEFLQSKTLYQGGKNTSEKKFPPPMVASTNNSQELKKPSEILRAYKLRNLHSLFFLDKGKIKTFLSNHIDTTSINTSINNIRIKNNILGRIGNSVYD
jgi:hypothetical protein